MKTKEMHGKIVRVTVAKATKWLRENNYDNRIPANSHIQQLARAMMNGLFKVTHQGIAFDINGRLVDGQHRLYAVIQSGKAQDIFVVFNAPEGTFPYLDMGRNRTAADKARELGFGDWYNRYLGCMAVRAFFGFRSSKSPSALEKVLLTEVHKAGAEFIWDRIKGTDSNITRSGVLGALLRFYYVAPKAMTSEVITALRSTNYTENSAYDMSAIRALRARLLETYNGERVLQGGGGKIENEIYRYTCYALKKTLDGEGARRLRQIESEVFELPDKIKKAQKEKAFPHKTI